MNFDVSTMSCLGNWRVEWFWLQSPPLSCHMTGVLKIFLQSPTIALLLHRISHVAHCVNILTEALLIFILLPKMAYVGLMVGEMEACTCVTFIAKSNNGSMETTNQKVDQNCAHMWKVDDENGILLLWISLSFIWITWGHGYTIIDFFSWTFMCPIFFQH